MTQAAALHQFFSGFGIPAYESTLAPTDAVLPYLTYETVSGAYDTLPAGCTANLWYRGSGNVPVNQKAHEICTAIGLMGKLLRVDDGYIHILRGSPWAVSAPDPDPTIRRRVLNLTLRFLTVN